MTTDIPTPVPADAIPEQAVEAVVSTFTDLMERPGSYEAKPVIAKQVLRRFMATALAAALPYLRRASTPGPVVSEPMIRAAVMTWRETHDATNDSHLSMHYALDAALAIAPPPPSPAPSIPEDFARWCDALPTERWDEVIRDHGVIYALGTWREESGQAAPDPVETLDGFAEWASGRMGTRYGAITYEQEGESAWDEIHEMTIADIAAEYRDAIRSAADRERSAQDGRDEEGT